MKSRKLKTLLSLSILLGLSGCVTGSIGRAPATISDYCLIAKPIAYDGEKDTPETVKAIEDHNSQWVCVCEHDCPTASK
jgi:hypothetical protein